MGPNSTVHLINISKIKFKKSLTTIKNRRIYKFNRNNKKIITRLYKI